MQELCLGSLSCLEDASNAGAALAGPRLRNLSPSCEVIDDQDQLVIVVAVEDLDVDAGLRHPAREQAELTGHVLLQSLNEHFPFREDSDAGGLERLAGGGSVSKEEMSDASAVHDPGPSPLDAHSGATQSLTHLRESARPVFQSDGQILHGVIPKTVTEKAVSVDLSGMGAI